MQQSNAALSLGMWWEKSAANDDVASGREYYNFFRDYDPSTGRYVESDPIGLLGGVNTYAYVNNKPILFMDIYGLISNCKQCKKDCEIRRLWDLEIVQDTASDLGGDCVINLIISSVDGVSESAPNFGSDANQEAFDCGFYIGLGVIVERSIINKNRDSCIKGCEANNSCGC